MFANGLRGAVQGRHRVVGQQKSDSRIVLRAPFTIERSKTIQPRGGPLSCPDADFEREDFLWKLIVAVQILEQGPKVRDRVRDSIGMIGIGSSAGQGFLETMSCSGFPHWQVLPEQVVESPNQTGTDRLK